MDAPTAEGDIKPKHISPNLTMSDSNAYVLEHTPPTFQVHLTLLCSGCRLEGTLC